MEAAKGFGFCAHTKNGPGWAARKLLTGVQTA